MPSFEYQRTRVILLLRDYPRGINTSRLAKEGKMSRNTVTKYLESLRAEGVVEYSKEGPAKMWRLKNLNPKISSSFDLSLTHLKMLEELINSGQYKTSDEAVEDAILKLYNRSKGKE